MYFFQNLLGSGFGYETNIAGIVAQKNFHDFQLEKDFPGLSLDVIPQAVHFFMEDKPKKVSEIIETVIRKKSWASNGIN